jgi:hypothetical protein
MLDITPLTYVKVTLLSVAVGCALNIIYRATAILWLFQLIIVGFCGMTGGKFIHRVSGYKLGKKIAPYVGIAVMVGILLDTTWIFLIPAALAHGEFMVLLMPLVSVVTVLVPIVQDTST